MHTCISALEATSFDMQVTLSAAQCEATPSRAGVAANALLAEERYARSKLQAQLDAALLEAAAKEAHVAAARAEARGLQARCEKMEIEARREAVSSCSRIGTLTCKIVELEQQLSSMSEELRNAHARTAILSSLVNRFELFVFHPAFPQLHKMLVEVRQLLAC